MADDRNVDGELEAELARLGHASGGPGAGFGAWLAAKLLRTHRYEATRTVGTAPREALRIARSVLAGLGRVTADASPGPIVGVVGSGHLNLNPTVVSITVVPADAGGATVVVQAVAKEGLVKQHSAQKAVTQVLDHLERLSR